MKTIATFLLSLFCAGTILGQALKTGINGTVQDRNGSGLGAVRVILHHNESQQYTETNSTGQYHLDLPAGIRDVSSFVYISYYKPGYENQSEHRLPNDPKPVILNKLRETAGYVQIKELKSGKFLGGMLIAIPGESALVSDQFGYVKIPLSPELRKDEIIRIAVDGNFRFSDTIRNVSVSDLVGNVVDIFLTPVVSQYPELIKNLEKFQDELTRDHSEVLAKRFINLFDLINNLPLTPKDQQQWHAKRPQFQPMYDYFQSGPTQKLNNLITKRKRLMDMYSQKMAETMQITEVKKAFKQYDELFGLGLEIANVDQEIYRCNGDGHLLSDDVNYLQEFLEYEKRKLKEIKPHINSEFYQERQIELTRKANLLLNIFKR